MNYADGLIFLTFVFGVLSAFSWITTIDTSSRNFRVRVWIATVLTTAFSISGFFAASLR